MSQHAACSPSSAAMWISCPASVTMTKDMTRPSSQYAREGTAAHVVAEMSLKGDIFLPDKVTVEGYEYIVSRSMCVAINPYISHVQSLTALSGATVFLEKRVRVPQTYDLVWGTLDCGVYAGGEFYVVDLKFGKGVTVGPEGPQLRFYALGLAHLFNMLDTRLRHTKVTLTICQPRVGGDPLRSHETTIGALMDWREAEVWPALNRITAGDETENAGAHCRWCVRKSECKAFAQKHQNLAAAVFDDGELFS